VENLRTLVPYLALVAVASALIVVEPDLGTAMMGDRPVGGDDSSKAVEHGLDRLAWVTVAHPVQLAGGASPVTELGMRVICVGPDHEQSPRCGPGRTVLHGRRHHSICIAVGDAVSERAHGGAGTGPAVQWECSVVAQQHQGSAGNLQIEV
jgi:hypothetical protein